MQLAEDAVHNEIQDILSELFGINYCPDKPSPVSEPKTKIEIPPPEYPTQSRVRWVERMLYSKNDSHSPKKLLPTTMELCLKLNILMIREIKNIFTGNNILDKVRKNNSTLPRLNVITITLIGLIALKKSYFTEPHPHNQESRLPGNYRPHCQR